MGNWWDVITSPVQQAVSNLGSNIAAAQTDAQQLGGNIYQRATSNEVTFTKPAEQQSQSYTSPTNPTKQSPVDSIYSAIYGKTPEQQSEIAAGVKFEHAPENTNKKDESGKTGGAAYTNKYAEQEGGVTAKWIEPISNRPGFRKTEDLGLDRKTWSLISEGHTPLQAVTMRLQEETKPSVRRELEWQQTQLAANKVEVSSDYHNWAKSTGKPQSINPFENEGDMALALMQGTSQEGKLQISKSNPDVSGLFADLPGGKGLTDRNWDSAKTGYNQKSPDFSKAVDWVESARYNPGVYGGLNSDRNYDAWNKARPEEQVKAISTNELLYGKSRSHKVPSLYGSFGSKTEPRMAKGHIKKYDKTITETLFGVGESHKVIRQKPTRGVKGTEWDMLDELRVKRPVTKKSQTALKDDIHYTKSKGSFQSMQKPNTSVRKKVVDEIDILIGSGYVKTKKTKSEKRSGSKQRQRKVVN